jgi:hypothetical protein
MLTGIPLRMISYPNRAITRSQEFSMDFTKAKRIGNDIEK